MSARPPAAAPRPESDVSSAVGLVGVAGLFAWVALCRAWPGIADALALPGPRAVLDGPYAALCGLIAAGLPMVVWSVLVERVHRRPSTGIDWSRPRPLSAALDVSLTKLAGLWATWAAIGFFYCVARWYWFEPYLFAMDVLGMAAIPLFVLSVPYVLWLDRVLIDPRDGAWHFGAMLIGREAFDRDEVWRHLRAWAVKGFFTAFMISILPGLFGEIVRTDFAALGGDPVGIARIAIAAMFLLDVQIGTVGYIVTFKPLDAQIRSANPFLAGWLAALLCYPPFVLMGTGGLMSYEVNTQDWAVWFTGYPLVLWVWGALLAALTACYAWATVIFGLRFSNLTYRGVITNGPYRFTRHPAYLSKNLFWWCSSLPFLVTSNSTTDVVRNCFFLALTNAIYFWRARTEEAHLSAEDAKYRDYHAWMAENAAITRGLGRLKGLLRPRGPVLQPAK
ncbi:MAG: methyltransferase family protein [Novosphingobium sp.]